MIAKLIGIASLLGVFMFAGSAFAQADLEEFKTKDGVEMLEAAVLQKLYSGNTFVGRVCRAFNRCKEANVPFETYSDASGSAATRIEGNVWFYDKARVGPTWWMNDGKFCTQFTSLLDVFSIGASRIGGCKWEFYRLGDEIRMYNPATGKLHAVYVVEPGDTRDLKSQVVK